MNDNNVISLPVSTDLSTTNYVAVKLTSTGIALASEVTDRVIGTMIRGNHKPDGISSAVGMSASVKLSSGSGLHFVTLGAGNTTAIAMGDELQLDTTNGTYCLRTTGACAGIAVESAAASSATGVIRAILLQTDTGTGPAPAEIVTATNVITAAESGTTFFLNSTTEFVSTLPAPALGLKYKFIVAAAPSGASYTIIAAASATIIVGQIVTNDFSGTTDSDFGTAGELTVTFVDGKAVKGDRVEFECDGTNWYVHGACSVFDAITIS